MLVDIEFQSQTKQVEIDVSEPVEILRIQLFSLFEVEPEQQLIITRGKIIKDDSNLGELVSQSGQRLILMSKNQPLKSSQKPVELVSLNAQQQQVVCGTLLSMLKLRNVFETFI
jgi:hypothetical protein